MTWNRLYSLLVVPCAAAFLTVGCGQGSPLSSSGSPGTLIGPTALTADGEADMAGLSSLSDGTFGLLAKGGNGGGNGNGNDEEKDRGPKGDEDDVEGTGDEESGAKPPKTDRGSLSGFVTAVTATTITVRGILVTVDADTEIRHGGNRDLTLADIQEGDHVQVKGTTTTTTTGTTFTATEIKVEDMDHDDDDDADDDNTDAKVVGTVAALAGTCPTRTFDVLSGTGIVTTTKVTTNADTNFHQVLCTALANDAVVEVKGTTQTDGSILAAKVSLED